MTYKIGHFYATTFSIKIPTFKYRDNERNPAITVGVAITSKKDENDYAYIASSLRRQSKADVIVYGTDGEVAMEKSFEREYPTKGIE